MYDTLALYASYNVSSEEVISPIHANFILASPDYVGFEKYADAHPTALILCERYSNHNSAVHGTWNICGI